MIHHVVVRDRNLDHPGACRTKAIAPPALAVATTGMGNPTVRSVP